MSAAIVQAERYARKLSVEQLLIKLQSKRGRDKVWLTVNYSPDWDTDCERNVVEAELRAEQRKRGLR